MYILKRVGPPPDRTRKQGGPPRYVCVPYGGYGYMIVFVSDPPMLLPVPVPFRNPRAVPRSVQKNGTVPVSVLKNVSAKHFFMNNVQ